MQTFNANLDDKKSNKSVWFKTEFLNKMESSDPKIYKTLSELRNFDENFFKLTDNQKHQCIASLIDACDDYIESIPKVDLSFDVSNEMLQTKHPNFLPVIGLCQKAVAFQHFPHFQYAYDSKKSLDDNFSDYITQLRWKLFASMFGSGQGKSLEKSHWGERRFKGNPFLIRYWVNSEYARDSYRSAKNSIEGFAYFNNPEQYKVHFKNGKLYVSDGKNEHLLDDKDCIAHVASHETIYAIDTNGNFYVFHNFVPKTEMGGIQHSSLLQGQEVLCAGTIKITDGELSYIDNASGHYKPKEKHLLKALKILSDKGVDLSKINTKDLYSESPDSPPTNAKAFFEKNYTSTKKRM